MADYVEKFKASDPFNMAGFNAKIDQINTAVGGGVTAANEAKTEAQAAATVANQALAAAESAGKVNLVWTNPNFAGGLTSVTINADFSKTKFLLIVYRDIKVATVRSILVPFNKIFNPEILAPCLFNGTRIYFGARELTCTDNKITIGDCEVYNTYGSNTVITTGTDRNECLVPLYVYTM